MKVLILILLATQAGVAAPALPLKNCTKAVTVKTNKAPCKGVLLPTSWAVQATKLKKVVVPKLKSELAFLREKTIAEIAALKTELQIERRFSKKQAALLNNALRVYKKPSWWEHPSVWVGVGLVVGAASTIAITYAIAAK